MPRPEADTASIVTEGSAVGLHCLLLQCQLCCNDSSESTDIILILQQFGTHSESERKTEKYDAQVSNWGPRDTIRYWDFVVI